MQLHLLAGGVMASGFADAVAGWSDEVQRSVLRVFHRAATLLGEELAKPRPEGATPHLTGNLIRSLLAKVNDTVSVGGSDDEYSGTDVGLAIAGAALGDSVTLGFQANYARRQNYGFVGEDKLGRYYNQSGAHFVERAAAMWPQLVDKAVQEVNSAP